MGAAPAAAGGTPPVGGLAGGLSKATPFIGMGLSAINMVGDLVQAGKQADMQKSAERAARDAAAKEEQLRSQNFFDALQVPMGAYDRAARETTAQLGQMTQALQEGDPRQLAGGVGKLAAAGIEGEAATRDAAAQDLYQLGVAQAQSAMGVNKDLATLEAQRLAGAQKTAAESRAAQLGLQQSAAMAGAGLINQGLAQVNSFGMDGEAPISTLQPVQSVNMAPAQQLQNNSGANVSAFMNKYQQPPSWLNSVSFLNKPQ